MEKRKVVFYVHTEGCKDCGPIESEWYGSKDWDGLSEATKDRMIRKYARRIIGDRFLISVEIIRTRDDGVIEADVFVREK